MHTILFEVNTIECIDYMPDEYHKKTGLRIAQM